MNEIIIQDLKKFKSLLLELENNWLNNNQELVFSILKLLVSEGFHTQIDNLRSKYKIPLSWQEYENPPEWKDDDILGDWIEIQDPKPPLLLSDQEIVDICHEHKIDALLVGEFVVDYLFYRKIEIRYGNGNSELFETNEEYRFKSKIRISINRYGEPIGTIQFYQDTTVSQLLNLIESKSDEIKRLKKYLKPYPHNKKHLNTKRDVLIFLMKKLGKKVSIIPEEIRDELLSRIKNKKTYTELQLIEKLSKEDKAIYNSLDLYPNGVYEIIDDVTKRTS